MGENPQGTWTKEDVEKLVENQKYMEAGMFLFGRMVPDNPSFKRNLDKVMAEKDVETETETKTETDTETELALRFLNARATETNV